VAIALGVSAVVHVIVVLVLLQVHVAAPSSTPGAAASSEGRSAVDMDPACLVEEVMTGLARASLCLPPSLADRDACLDKAFERFELARLACVNVGTPIELTMVDVSTPPPAPAADEDPLDKMQEIVDEAEQMHNPTVDIAPPQVELEPDKADLNAEYNSRVAKESVKRGAPSPVVVQGSANVREQPASSEGKQAPSSGGTPGRQGALDMRGSRENSARGGSTEVSSVGSTGTPDGREPSETGDGARRGLGVSLDTVPGTGGGGELGDGSPRQGPPNVRPGKEVIARAASGSYDGLQDIDEGEETLLNTKRFKYASFFNRVKRAVWENWHADRAYALRDPDGKIYGIKDRQTVLKVTLRPDGSLAHVMVESPCGVDFLDDEAVSAFKKAQPFPNPPAGLVDSESKLITFRFGFLLEIQDKPSWRIVRYQ
jgi:TonB family protein